MASSLHGTPDLRKWLPQLGYEDPESIADRLLEGWHPEVFHANAAALFRWPTSVPAYGATARGWGRQRLMALVEVAEIAELTENVPLLVSAAGAEIALFKRNGTVHAVRNDCPHQTSSYAGGFAADEWLPGGLRTKVELDHDHPVVVCLGTGGISP